MFYGNTKTKKRFSCHYDLFSYIACLKEAKANEHSCISMQHRALYITNYVTTIVAGHMKLFIKHFCETLRIVMNLQ